MSHSAERRIPVCAGSDSGETAEGRHQRLCGAGNASQPAQLPLCLIAFFSFLCCHVSVHCHADAAQVSQQQCSGLLVHVNLSEGLQR